MTSRWRKTSGDPVSAVKQRRRRASVSSELVQASQESDSRSRSGSLSRLEMRKAAREWRARKKSVSSKMRKSKSSQTLLDHLPAASKRLSKSDASMDSMRDKLVRSKSWKEMRALEVSLARSPNDLVLSLVSPRAMRSDTPAKDGGSDRLCSREYFPMLFVIMRTILAEVDTQVELDRMFLAATEMLKVHGLYMDFVSYCLNREVKTTQGDTTVFRQRSVATMMCASAFRGFAGRSYLAHIVSPVLWEIINTERPLTDVLDDFFEALQESFESRLPNLLRMVLQRVYGIMTVRLPKLAMQAIANFFFLRFVLPALSAPQQYIEIKVDEGARERLMRASKLLQYVGNNTLPEGHDWLDELPWLQEKQASSDAFFVSLIRARISATLSEPETLEFDNHDIAELRQQLLMWIMSNIALLDDKWGSTKPLWEAYSRSK